MDTDSWIRLHDPEEHYFKLKAAPLPVPDGVLIAEGMVQFAGDSARRYFAPPYPGGCVRYRLTDHTGFPVCAANNKKLEDRARSETFYHGKAKDRVIEVVTLERPVCLWLHGPEAESWSKFYPTVAEAQAELDLILGASPVAFDEILALGGFVFTN